MEVYTTTPLISMIIRTAGSERNNSLNGHHCRPECFEDDDLVKKVGVDGCHEDEVVVGCAGWVGSRIRQQCACDGDESQDVSGDSSRHPRKQPVLRSKTFRIATQTAIGRTGGVHTSVLAVNEHSLCGDPFCVQSVN